MLLQCRCMFKQCRPEDSCHYLRNIYNIWLRRQFTTVSTPQWQRVSLCLQSKQVIDYSQVPRINEDDLEEKFVRGSGPGGSAVNKNSNCVVVTHIPTEHMFNCENICLRPYLASAVQRRFLSITSCIRSKQDIDYSRVPEIKEDDLEEKFVRGSGPGGQAVNKNSNCVVLTHVPTGTVVKCHLSRSQDVNRRLAREMLASKLDDVVNGEASVKAQIKAAQEHKSNEQSRRSKRLREMKSKWKEREGLVVEEKDK